MKSNCCEGFDAAEPLTGGVVLAYGLDLAQTACLWWTFFTGDVDAGEHKLAASPVGAGRTWLVLSGYFYSHTPILLGAVAAAFAVLAVVPLSRLAAVWQLLAVVIVLVAALILEWTRDRRLTQGGETKSLPPGNR